VKASNERPVLFIYYGEGVARRSIAKLLTRDVARRIAAGIANLPDLVQRLLKGAHQIDVENVISLSRGRRSRPAGRAF
jgi:hypothetical protein